MIGNLDHTGRNCLLFFSSLIRSQSTQPKGGSYDIIYRFFYNNNDPLTDIQLLLRQLIDTHAYFASENWNFMNRCSFKREENARVE